jgi:hypothetical protein
MSVPRTVDDAIKRLVNGIGCVNNLETDHLSVTLNEEDSYFRRDWHFRGGDPPGHIDLNCSAIVRTPSFLAFLEQSFRPPYAVAVELPATIDWHSRYYNSGFPYENEEPKNEEHHRNASRGTARFCLDWTLERLPILKMAPSLDHPLPTLGFIDGRDFLEGRGRWTQAGVEAHLAQKGLYCSVPRIVLLDNDPQDDTTRLCADPEYVHVVADDGPDCLFSQDWKQARLSRGMHHAMVSDLLREGKAHRVMDAYHKTTGDLQSLLTQAEKDSVYYTTLTIEEQGDAIRWSYALTPDLTKSARNGKEAP